ncbi:MAG: hypothetical protein H0Z33_00355 [Bacillaceae bacterium]|nr:hypothetical protein [Bacillaceae bacterium]
MKPFHQANPALLQQLFRWKKQQGEWIRYEIVEHPSKKWVVHFYSEDQVARDRHIFASFTGENPDEMNQWAISQLVDFNLE